ncbi:MAG TPA: hypothetical protein VMZ53_07475 [Kofleriaceae bacterium]|nr:hypothetical protein [Kofleriaceae bacterium]
MLTRFVPSVAPAREPVGGEPAAIEDVRCVARVRGAGGIRELVVGTDANGNVIVTADRGRLGQRARGELAFHETAASGRVLELDTDALYIFDLQTMEMLPDAPGPNDALYVYGLMYGPYPEFADAEVVAVEGQLTVTRADFLGGLVDGVATTFVYPPDAHGSRCVHALLPGERADVIDTGKGVILALPLVPTWLPECPLSNDLVVAQLVYDVLVALRADLGVTQQLPVPNRAALEAELVAQGWTIEGDEATRGKKGLLGALRGEKKQLPRQGTLDELVAEARAALSRMSNVPTPEAHALRRRMQRMQPAQVSPKIPAPVVQPPLPPRAQPVPKVKTDKSEWMKDFVDAHRSPSRPTPRVSAPARAVSHKATPAWMEDFAPTKTNKADDD